MRNAGRLKAGYYPCPQEAIRELLKRLRPPKDGPCAILDPCAGEGAALLQIVAGLGLDDRSAWLVELDPTRGERCRELMPQATILAPCSFLSTAIRMGTFSLVYCNPPFDDSAVQGVRVEEQFLARVVHLLTEGGILVFVCPEATTKRPGFRDIMLPWFEAVELIPWPHAVRGYGEVFVVARRRETINDPDDRTWWKLTRGTPKHYRLPSAKGPGKRFLKTGFTETELIEALEASPLHKKLEPAQDYHLPTPPLALNVGHLALLLAAGQLDGVVYPPGEPPHIVRGVAQKKAEITEQVVEKTRSKKVTKTTYTEKIRLIVRAVGLDGEIRTFGEDSPTETSIPAETSV